MGDSELISDHQFGAVTCDGFPSSSGASQKASQRAPSSFGMTVDIIEPRSSGFLYFGDSHSDLFQSACHINNISVQAVFPDLCFDHVESAEMYPFLPLELALSNQACELSAQPAPPDQGNETVVVNVAGTSRVSDVAANVLMPGGGTEVLPVSRDEGSKAKRGRRPKPNSKLYYGKVSQSRLNMITALESGISPQLLQRLRDDSKEYLPTEEEKLNAIVKYLNNRKEDPFVAKYGVKELAGYIVKGFCYLVSGVERGSFQGLKRDAMKSYTFFKRRKMDDAYVELLITASKLESISALGLKD